MNYSPMVTMVVKNFQAVESATIHFGQLTILVGAGDSGKSSLLRAFRALCLNDAHDLDIRHHQKQLEVELTFEDGTVIQYWKKKGQGGCYTLEYDEVNEGRVGVEFSKTAGQVPPQIAEYLGIGLINLDAQTELTPQLSDQHDTPFILWETGSKRARILGKATRLDTVVTAQMACKKERDEATSMVKECVSSLEVVCVNRNIIPDYKSMGLTLEQCSADIDLIDAETAHADRALELDDLLAEVRSRAVVDVVKYTAWLDQADKSLDYAQQLESVSRELPKADYAARKANQVKNEAGEALALATVQYENACDTAGVCHTCGGLLNHEECT